MTSAADEWEASRYAERRLRERLTPFRRSPGTVLGIVLAVVLASGAWIVDSVWRTAAPPKLADGTAVLLADGRSYVLDDGILYPAANATSARLAAERVEHRENLDLSRYPIGEPRGIPGALTSIPDRDLLMPADWQLCDGASPPTFTVGAAPYLPPPAGEGTLVSDGAGLWLVSNGSRAPLAVPGADPALAVPTSPTLVSLLPGSTNAPSPDTVLSPGGVVCAQSDPLAPFAQPSAAAIARRQQHRAPSNNGTQVVMTAGSGLLVPRSDSAGYWLLTATAELAPIADDAALTRLGYRPEDATEIPPALLTLFTPGPMLSISAAKAPL